MLKRRLLAMYLIEDLALIPYADRAPRSIAGLALGHRMALIPRPMPVWPISLSRFVGLSSYRPILRRATLGNLIDYE
jgi:hypothetical protein